VESGEAYEHVTAALHYQNQSIAELNRNQSIVHVTQETCEPVVLVTALNAVCTLLASMVPVTSGEQLESLPEVMLRTRRYMLGLNEVVEHCRSWAEDSELARIFMSPTVQKLEDGGLMTADIVQALCDKVLAGMDLNDTATLLFRSILEKLEKAYVDNNGRSVFSWLVIGSYGHLGVLGSSHICPGRSMVDEVRWQKDCGRPLIAVGRMRHFLE
jgi:hypothetical protein